MSGDIDYDRLGEALRRRREGQATVSRGADPEQVAAVKDSLWADSYEAKSSRGGGRSLLDQGIDTFLDVGKGVVTGLPAMAWDSTVGAVGGTLQNIAGRDVDEIRERDGLLGAAGRLFANESMIESVTEGDSLFEQFRNTAPILGEPLASLRDFGGRLGEVGEVAFGDKAWEDTQYAQANRDSQIVPLLFEDVGNVLLAVMGAGGAAGATKGAVTGARAGTGAVAGARAGARGSLRGTGPASTARRVDDAIGRAILSPLRSPTIASRLVTGEGRTPRARYRTGKGVTAALGATRAGQAFGRTGIANRARVRGISPEADVRIVNEEMDLGNKVNAVRRGEEALGPAQQVYEILSGKARNLPRKQRRSMEVIDHANAAAVLDMIDADVALPLDRLDRLRTETPDAYTELVGRLGAAYGDDLSVGAMDTFLDYKLGKLDADLADDIAATTQVWRDEALDSTEVRDVLGEEVPIGARQNQIEGTGRPAVEKERGRAWRERSATEAEVLPNNIDPIRRKGERGRRRFERDVERARSEVDRLGARRRVSDEALADPKGYSEAVFGQATAEARRLVATNPDVVAQVQEGLARPLSQDGLVSRVRDEILTRRRQLDGLNEVPATPLFEAAAAIDRPLFVPRRTDTAGLTREAMREGGARRARRSQRWNTGRLEQNAARAEQIRAERAPVEVSKKALHRVAAGARRQARAQGRERTAQSALKRAEARLAAVQPNDRPAIRNAIRDFRREQRAQMEADRDAVVATLTDQLERVTGGDTILLRSADDVAVVEAALREAGSSADWTKFQYPGTTKRIFKVDQNAQGQGRMGGIEADRLGIDDLGVLVGEILVPLRRAREQSFAGIVDNGIDYADSWLAATEEEAAFLVGPVDEAVDAWVQAEGNPAAAAREDLMWDEAVERMNMVYALREAGEPIAAALDGASPGARKAVHAMLAEEAARAADEALGARIDDTAAVLGEQGARIGRRQGRAEGRAEGRAAQAKEAAARDARVKGSAILPEMQSQAAARAGGSAVAQAGPELRLAGQQQRALRDLGRKERRLARYDAAVEAKIAAAQELITSAPARFRPMVELGRVAHRVLEDFDFDEFGVDPSLAGQIHAGVLTSVADALVKGDPDFMRGGSATLLTQTHGVSSSKAGGAKRVQGGRLKQTGRVPLSLSKQAILALRDIRQQTTNETMFRVAERVGKSPSSVVDEYARRYGMTAEEAALSTSILDMASDLYGGEWVGWNPMSLFPEVFDEGGKRRAKFIDDTGEDAMMLAPRWVPEAFEYAASQDNAFAQALIDKPTRVFKGAVLALSPRWMVGNVVSGAIMLHAADVTVADIGRHMRESYREMRTMSRGKRSTVIPREMVDTGLTANEMRLMQNLEVPALDNLDYDEVNLSGQGKGGKVRRAGAAVVRTGYGLNTFVDNWYKSIAAMTKAEEMGWKRGSGQMLPEGAVREALQIMGDYDRMTTFERRVLRRAFPFYAWVRHITGLTRKVANDDPARMLWNIHLANVFAPEDELWEQVPWLRGAISTGDEYLNIGWMFPFDTTAQMDLRNPSSLLAGNLNPVISTGLALGTGFDTSFGDFSMLSRPGARLGGESPLPPIVSDPVGSAYLVGRNLPQFRGAWNEAQRRLNDGQAFRQYDTGQVRRGELDANRTGTNNVATVLNIPLPRKYDVEGSLARGRR